MYKITPTYPTGVKAPYYIINVPPASINPESIAIAQAKELSGLSRFKQWEFVCERK